jgi:hypothetical protein
MALVTQKMLHLAYIPETFLDHVDQRERELSLHPEALPSQVSLCPTDLPLPAALVPSNSGVSAIDNNCQGGRSTHFNA